MFVNLPGSETSEEDTSSHKSSWRSSGTNLPALRFQEHDKLPGVLDAVLKDFQYEINDKPGFYKFVNLVAKRFASHLCRYYGPPLKSGVSVGCFG